VYHSIQFITNKVATSHFQQNIGQEVRLRQDVILNKELMTNVSLAYYLEVSGDFLA
jgi:hypothetical protein